jgi:SAM-dependent methyltransferase
MIDDTDTEHFRRIQERYRNGEMPWNHQLPPPEIMALVERETPGRALDLGCGTARAAIYLAQHGWQVDGVDFVPEAVERARERVHETRVTERVRLFQGSVTRMDFLAPPYDLALDVGCMHGLDAERQALYAAEVARLLRAGGRYLLFARLRDPGNDQDGPGIADDRVAQLFGTTFTLASFEPGFSTFGETRSRSAWYELIRQDRTS